MLRRIWNDPVWSKVIAGVILATGSAVAIGLTYLQGRDVPVVNQRAISTDSSQPSVQSISIGLGSPTIVEEHKAFVDPATGFVFTIDEIDDGRSLWGLASRVDGALGWYAFPDGTKSSYFRYPVGHRVPFDFAGRTFAFVLVDIDYDQRQAVVRVDELAPGDEAGSTSAGKDGSQ